MKYLVMEKFDSYAVLLDEEGCFVKSANLGYEVGDTIQNPVLMRDEPLEKKPQILTKRFITGIIAFAAMVILFFGYNFYQNNYVQYSSIFMTINPEVEIVLNRNGEVLKVEGANADGISLLEGFESESADKVAVANKLVDRAFELGFLAAGGEIYFAIDTPDQLLFEEYDIELREDLSKRSSITVEIMDVDSQNNLPEQQPDLEPEGESELESELQPEPEPEHRPKQIEPKPDPESKPDSEPKPGLELKPDPELKPDSEPKRGLEPKPDPESEPDPAPKPDPESEPDPAPEPDSEPKPVPESKPDTESIPEPELESE